MNTNTPPVQPPGADSPDVPTDEHGVERPEAPVSNDGCGTGTADVPVPDDGCETGTADAPAPSVAGAAAIEPKTVERTITRAPDSSERSEVAVDSGPAEIPVTAVEEVEGAVETPEPTAIPTPERTVLERIRDVLGRPVVRGLLLALPAALIALWAVLFVPLDLGVALVTWALLPLSLVAVPWLVSVAVTAIIDRRG